MTIEKLEALERAKDDPTCSADEYCERCTKFVYAQQAAFPALLAVAKAAKAYHALASGPYDDSREGEFLELQVELGAAIAQLEATP